MEKKNTVLLTVIAVATLLVAVVGATFAYFTATTAGTGTGTATTNTTTTVGSVALDLVTTTNTGDIKYPGGMMVNGASVTATVTGAGTFSATYDINYEVDATALSSANTTVNYTLYRTTSAITGDAMSGCTLQTDATGGVTKYYYTGCTKNAALTDSVKVDSDTISSANLGTKVTKTVSDTTSFTGLTNAATKSVYYYLVVDYVNSTTGDQNADMTKGITATVKNITNANAVAAAA